MSLPDPAELLAIADRIADHAFATRRRADLLAGAIAASTWLGAASNAFAARADDVLVGLRHSAARLEDAVDTLRRHAVRVQHAIEAIHAFEQRLTHAMQTVDELGLATSRQVAHTLDTVVGLGATVGLHEIGGQLDTITGALAPGFRLVGSLLGGD